MEFIRALSGAIRVSTKQWRMLLLLYLINILSALPLALAARTVVAKSLGDSLSLESLVPNFDFTVYSDFLAKSYEQIRVLISEVRWFILLYMIVNTLLAGGVLVRLGTPEASFSLASFFESCGKFFLRFVRLLVLFGILLFVAGSVSLLALGLVHAAIYSDSPSEIGPVVGGAVLVLLFVLMNGLVVMISDYARVDLVVNDGRSILKSSWTGVKFVFGHLGQTVALQSIMALIVIVTIVVYLKIENPLYPATTLGVLGLFLIQQGTVVARIWTRVATISGQRNLFVSLRSVTEAPTSVSAPTTAPPPLLLPPAAAPPAVPEIVPKRRIRRTVTRARKSPRTRPRR